MARRTKPIPLELLIHNITYQEMGESDGWDDAPKGKPIHILRVRVQPIDRERKTSNSEGVAADFELFVDRTYSSYYPEFKVGSIVTFNNKTYTISDVSPFYDFDVIPHHYEIGLR